MRSFIIAVIMASVITVFCIVNSVVLNDHFRRISRILDEFPVSSDVNDTELAEKLTSEEQRIEPYLFLVIPRNAVNELKELTSETVTYFHSQDDAVYRASLEKLKIKVYELEKGERPSW